MNKAKHLYKLLRPKHWLKNFFLFAPLIFSLELFQTTQLLTAIRALLVFCLTASAVYIINDIADLKSDRKHPVKKERPIAANLVSIAGALSFMMVLIMMAGLVAFGMDYRFQIVLVSYFVLNLVYSLTLKNVVLLDVFLIALGFMMRILAGAYAIDVQVSSWIVLCSLFISLFLGFAKRRAEIILTQQHGIDTERKVLTLYRVDFIDQMLTIAAGGAVVSYALYTVAPRTLELLGTDKMIYTTVFVFFGVSRYLLLVHTKDSTENPTDVLTSDLAILTTGILWILSCILIIYFR